MIKSEVLPNFRFTFSPRVTKYQLEIHIGKGLTQLIKCAADKTWYSLVSDGTETLLQNLRMIDCDKV